MFSRMILLSSFVTSLAFAAPEVIPAPVKHLYVPQGYDSNDAVEVVLTGQFPNPCYSRNTVSVEVNDDVIDVTVTALLPQEKVLCPQVAVPFKEVVSIGNLQGGTYKISVNNKLNSTLNVEESVSGAVDEHLYASIESLEKKSEDEYVLKGYRYSSCLELDRVEVVSNGVDTLSVLPIMKVVSDFCPMKMTPVSYPVKLNLKKLKFNEPLIHVRTMDGKSFNKIIFGAEK